MNQWTKLAGIALLTAAIGCGDKAAPHNDSSVIDSPSIDARPVDAPAGTTALTVKNYLAWCSVTVNGGTPSSSSVQTVNVAPGTINLAAVALTGFKLGTTPWHDTAGDTGLGEQGTVMGTGQSASSATTVVVGTAAKCVWVCCEFAAGGGCPTADQCP